LRLPFTLFITLLIVPLSKLAGQDSLNFGPPVITRDTIRVTRPIRKVPIKFTNRQIRLMNKIARDVPQGPLPEGFSATFVDTALVSYEHVTALEDYFTAEVEADQDSSIFDVLPELRVGKSMGVSNG
jgi:hypothetical protein